ncbi:MAG: hypothetical protein ACRDRA_03875 [Pseudonocardiaceae bacterium]
MLVLRGHLDLVQDRDDVPYLLVAGLVGVHAHQHRQLEPHPSPLGQV